MPARIGEMQGAPGDLALFGQVGFSASAFLPCYGQAETTLATTFAPIGGGFDVEYVDRDDKA